MNKPLLKRIVMVCIATLIMGFAVSLSVYAALGTDPCTCLNLGISHKIGMSFGTWQLIFNCTVLVFTFFFARHLIGFGTVVNMVAIGYLVDFYGGILAHVLPADPTVFLRLVCMLCGVVILAFTAALYMYPRLGVSPYDSIGFILTERTHIQFRWCRIACDVLAVLIGFLTGSIVGLGTVITAFCMGPLIKLFGDILRKRIPLQFG